MVEFLKPNFYFGVKFSDGPLFFKVVDREIVRYEGYQVGVVQAGSTKENIDPKDNLGNYILEPDKESIIYHVFVGIDPELAELYLEYPIQYRRFGLIYPPTLGGNVKWIDGITSPLDNPSEESELFTFKDLRPIFHVYNASDRTEEVVMNFYIAKYTYQVVKDEDLIRKLAEGKVACKYWGFTEPIQPPAWITKMFGNIMAIGKKYVTHE